MPTRGSRWAFALTLALVSTTGLLWARDLTFEDRVKAQEAIERVYWSHRIWPKENPGPRPALSSMVSDAVIHAKVADYLRKSNALEQLWHRRITAGQLEAEIARMARETRNPSMLAELFASLNDDPILVAECLARPLLAERLVRNLYVRDEALHRATRLKAEQALSRYSSMKALGEHGGRYSETGFVRLGSPLIRPREDETRVSLDEADWDRLMRDLEPRVGPGMPESQTGLESRGRTDSAGLSKGSCRPGDGSLSQSRPDLGPRRSIDESGGERRPPALLENDESFFVTTVLARDATHIDLATVSWEKPSLVTWWRRVGGEFSTHLDLPPTVPGPLPALAAECADDTWSGMPFGSPDDIGGETAVWTGDDRVGRQCELRRGHHPGHRRSVQPRHGYMEGHWLLGESPPGSFRPHRRLDWTRNAHLGRDGNGQRAESAARRRQSIRSTHRRMVADLPGCPGAAGANGPHGRVGRQ
jgi:hypothetical protein